MSKAEEEYEVETVVLARVHNKRKNKVFWKYQVKWKGYGIEDNTWEPAESFDGGSEHMLTKFWERVNLGGRDMNDASLFKIGEEFLPMGPPRKAKHKKATTEGGQEERLVSSLDGPQTQSISEENKTESSKRRRSSLTQTEGEPMEKRKRGLPSKADQSAKSATNFKRDLSPSNFAKTDSMQSTSASISRIGSSPGPSDVTGSRPSINGEASNKRTTIPTSSEESVNALLLQEPPSSALLRANNTCSQDIIERSQEGNQIAQDSSGDPLFDSPNAVNENIESSDRRSASTNKPSILPSHRARAANPLIKMVDDLDLSHGMNSAISTKARLLGAGVSHEGSPVADPLRTSTSKRGPGRASQGLQAKNRSSLLVFEKGSLKSVKGKFTPSEANSGNTSTSSSENAQVDREYENGLADDTMEVDGILALDPFAEKVPTGKELLQMAGLSVGDTETLPDFEDDDPVQSTPDPNEGSVQSSFAQAVGNLFPTQSSSLFSNFSIPWKRSTIFDPLGFGTNADGAFQSDTVAPSALVATWPTWSLSLDSSVTISIVLKDVFQVTGSPSLEDIVTANPKGPPGKFYRQEIAFTLLDTLQPGGSSARVEVGEAANEPQEKHFERFRDRLEKGELFIGLAGQEVLAISFSGNKSVGQKLGVPEMLRGLSSTVIVSRVVIANHSAYADIACQAEHVRW